LESLNYIYSTKEEEILRNLQAAGFNLKKTHININKSHEWRIELFPVKITTESEKIIVLNKGIFT
jgi:hypothetical protein